MSRIGKKSIELPKDVKVAIDKSGVKVEGLKGKLEIKMLEGVSIEQKDNQLFIERNSNIKQHRANHGTFRAKLANMVKGVSEGHKRDLEIQGIGFRAQLQGNKILFNLGLSHPVEFDIPSDVKVVVPSQTSITIEGVDIERVAHIADRIKAVKPVEPYKGKGIRYVGQFVRRKQGKSVAK
ncbi:MAG: 50S ribosomal protein L6 [Candidatus Omnitrophica bacterium]|nr:50S ribosomal protein L6 [Candidatus Omnitrophota bacterium]